MTNRKTERGSHYWLVANVPVSGCNGFYLISGGCDRDINRFVKATGSCRTLDSRTENTCIASGRDFGSKSGHFSFDFSIASIIMAFLAKKSEEVAE